MAYPQADANKISMVKEVTGITDEALIARALQAKNGDPDQVVMEFFETGDGFRSKYANTWDESAFSSNREGDIQSGTDVPSFAVHPPDNQVLYGSDPGFGYASGAPSRPPSRANNRSPLSSMADITTGGYGVRSAQEQEDDDFNKAIAASLSTSQAPHSGSGPLQAPQQESGITGASISNAQFGPANRPDYDPNEWAMVQLKHNDPDPDPTGRTRTEGVPVFLRCRSEETWKHHRIGGLLTVLHSIPASRNAFLRLGDEPAYGYGHDSEWWKGKPILPPETQQNQERWVSEGQKGASYLPPWKDELHRLMAFLDSTERSYGTADILSICRPDGVGDSGNPEVDFFESYTVELSRANGNNGSNENGVVTDRTLTTTAVVGSIGEDEPAMIHNLAHLDWTLGREALAGTESLYDIWDLMFFPDADDLPSRAAAITHPAEVIVFRFADEEGFEQPIQVPETFYIDRYMQENRDKVWRNLLDSQAISTAFKKSAAMERYLTSWVNPNNQRTLDRRVLIKKSIEECQQKIARIKNRAAWAEHEKKPFNPDEFYVSEHHGEPTLKEDEVELVRYYEEKIRKMEKSLADMENTLNNVILPERDKLRKLSLEARKLFKDPAPDVNWYPTHKYTLRGVVSEPNKIFLRKREQVLMEMEDNSTPGEQWFKMWTLAASDNAVLHQMVSFNEVLSEALGRGKAPVLIFASEKAMAEEPEPLSNALKTFVKFDNRIFKQDLLQSEQYSNSREKKRGVNGIGSAFDSESKRLNRASSMDSMATNQASAGDLDDYMVEGAYDLDEARAIAASIEDPMAMSLDGVIAAEQLVDVSDSTSQIQQQKAAGTGSADDPVDLLTPNAPEQDVEMLLSNPPDYVAAPESPTIGRASLNLASVNLGGDNNTKDAAATKAQQTQQQPEMQERASIPLITRPDNTASLGSGPMDMSSGDEAA